MANLANLAMLAGLPANYQHLSVNAPTSRIGEFQCHADTPSHLDAPTPPINEPPSDQEPAFTLFKDLPHELQDAIWERALPGPRIVYLQARMITRGRTWSETLRQGEQVEAMGSRRKRDNSREELTGELRDAVSSPYYKRPSTFGFFTSSNEILFPLLHCTQQSRLAVQRRYAKTFSSPTHPAETYFDLTHDTLYLDWGCKSGGSVSGRVFSPWDFKAAEAEKVMNLALYDGRHVQHPGVPMLMSKPRGWYSYWLHRSVLPDFKNLQSLVIVDRQHCDKTWNCKDLVMMDRVADVSSALRLYWLPDARIKHPSYDHEVKSHHADLERIVRQNAPMRVEYLKHFLKDGHAGPSNPYTIPAICEARTITTRERVEEYERAKVWFAKLKEGYFVHAKIRADGYPTVTAQFGADKTLRQMANFYCREMDIYGDFVLQGALANEYWEDWEECQNTKVYDLRWERGQKFTLYLAVPGKMWIE